MNPGIVISATILLAGTLTAAESSLKDDVANATKKLSEASGYSWTTKVAVPEGSRFRPATEGKTEKDGYTYVTITSGENTTQMAIKGDKTAVAGQEGIWQSLVNFDPGEGPGRFSLAGLVRGFKTPVTQATELADSTREWKKDGDAFSGDLTDERAKTLITFRNRGSGGESANFTGVIKGTVKFWIKDGLLSKYEFRISGRVNLNGNEREVDRTTTVEIKNVGSTKVDVPEEAKKKLL